MDRLASPLLQKIISSPNFIFFLFPSNNLASIVFLPDLTAAKGPGCNLISCNIKSRPIYWVVVVAVVSEVESVAKTF